MQKSKCCNARVIQCPDWATPQFDVCQKCLNHCEKITVQTPIVIERFADNGEHSHWELIDANGEVLCSELIQNELRDELDRLKFENEYPDPRWDD